MGLIINLFTAIVILLQYLIEPQSFAGSTLTWIGVRTGLAFIWIVTTYCILRRLNRHPRYSRKIDISLDVLSLMTSANLYSVVGNFECESFGTVGVFTYGWCLGIAFICAITIIGSWRIRALAIFLQVSFFIIVGFAVQQYSTVINTLRLIQALVVYLVVIYIEERYLRFEFLEKRKIYEDSEAIKKILDDITEGILIVSPEKQILYANKPMKLMFNLAELTLDGLFAQIRVVSMSGNVLKSAIEKSILEISSVQVI